MIGFYRLSYVQTYFENMKFLWKYGFYMKMKLKFYGLNHIVLKYRNNQNFDLLVCFKLKKLKWIYLSKTNKTITTTLIRSLDNRRIRRSVRNIKSKSKQITKR